MLSNFCHICMIVQSGTVIQDWDWILITLNMAPVPGIFAKIVSLVPIFGTGARHICLNLNKSALTLHQFIQI